MHTPGTIHIITSDDKSRDILWDDVWCKTCVENHKKILGKDIEIRETPWTGEARPCGSCDDSENAEDFKFQPESTR